LLRPDITGNVECGPDKKGSDEPMDSTESGVIESSGGGPDRIESNSGGPDKIGSGPDRTGSDHDGPDKSVLIPKTLYRKVANGNEAVRRRTATMQKHRKIANHHSHQSKIGLS
jgi:hypothetical protein